MKKLFLVAVAIISTLQLSQAKDFDLSKISSNGIYSAEVGGIPQDGVLERVSVTLPEYKQAVLFTGLLKNLDYINQTLPFCTDDLMSIFTSDRFKPYKPQNQAIFIALELTDGDYMVLQPISALYATSWIEILSKNKVELVCGSMGTANVETTKTPMLAYAKGSNLYGLLASMWSDILANDQVEGRTNWRTNKKYAEAYKYLGWCSWEQYKKDINEELLVSAVDKIERSEIPVRWVLIDDGHQTATGSGLVNYTINADKFPNGWAPIIDKRSDKVKWFGLWHCMYGLWGGISTEHTMDDLREYVVSINRPSMVGEHPEGSRILYEKLVNSVADPGFDFTKIDVQTRDFVNYIGGNNAVAAHRQNAENLEAQTNAKLTGLMNCMAINLPCVFNTRYSATTRVSIDYKLNNTQMARSHIYQSFHNTAWMGQTVWPDHDMFHSSDVLLGRLMAVSKAMSGAPVYMSDAPEDFRAEFILPLAYSDGELLRPLAPGTPLSKSFFADAYVGEDAYSVIAPMTAKSAAIVAYNVSTADTAKVSITECDYCEADIMVQPYPGKRTIPSEGLVYYDWYEKKGGKLQGEYSFNLDNATDRIVLLAEIEEGWSVIGREDKYLSTVAVKSYTPSKKTIDITLYEAGPVVVYSKKAIKSSTSGSVKAIGGDLYLIDAKSENITLKR